MLFCKSPDLVLGGVVEGEPVSAYLGHFGPELVYVPGFAVLCRLVRVFDPAPVSDEVNEPDALAVLSLRRSRPVLHPVAWAPGEIQYIAKPNIHQEACAVAAHGAGVPLRAGAGAPVDSHNFVAILVHFEVHGRLVRGGPMRLLYAHAGTNVVLFVAELGRAGPAQVFVIARRRLQR